MKQNIFRFLLSFLFLFGLYACSSDKIKPKEIIVNKDIQQAIDSIVDQSKMENAVYELFSSGYPLGGDILLHIGKTPYYSDSTLCLSYLRTHGTSIRVYSGMESYFNLLGKPIPKGKEDTIWQNQDHHLWTIRIYERQKPRNKIIKVYKENYAVPFSSYSSTPEYKKWIDIIDPL